MTATELKKIRAQLGWTQQKLADAVGLTRNSIARYEMGMVNMRESVARLIQMIAKAERGQSASGKRAKTSRKGHALQLLEEYQAKRLGIYRVVHKRAADFFQPYLTHCKKYNKATTIEDKERTLGFFKKQAGDPWIRQLNKKMVVDYLDS